MLRRQSGHSYIPCSIMVGLCSSQRVQNAIMRTRTVERLLIRVAYEDGLSVNVCRRFL
jgi:hypothetical protein